MTEATEKAREMSLISIKGAVATELGRIQRDDAARQDGVRLTPEHLEERVASLEQTVRDIHVTFEFMREQQKDEPVGQGRTVDVDGVKDRTCDIRYIGKATEQPDGTWRCLADVNGALCVVQVRISEG